VADDAVGGGPTDAGSGALLVVDGPPRRPQIDGRREGGGGLEESGPEGIGVRPVAFCVLRRDEVADVHIPFGARPIEGLGHVPAPFSKTSLGSFGPYLRLPRSTVATPTPAACRRRHTEALAALPDRALDEDAVVDQKAPQGVAGHDGIPAD